MDLVYLILSVILRLSPVTLNPSTLQRSRMRRQGVMELAMWIPVAGWLSVSVRQNPNAIWLHWRVWDVRSIDRSSLDSHHVRDSGLGDDAPSRAARRKRS